MGGFNAGERVVITGGAWEGKRAEVLANTGDESRVRFECADGHHRVVSVVANKHLVTQIDHARDIIAAMEPDADGFVELTVRAIVQERSETDHRDLLAAFASGQSEELDAFLNTEVGWDLNEPDIKGYVITGPGGTVLYESGQYVPEIKAEG